ncbi:MAG TPA: twin-arginine translocase TatA/TatE family subunit [Micropruina sp.]|jgi:sec-independent protein translocase protein TatA|nr:twin-arginine translocase TatA/TatE family subunit [Micropruina sp.]
MFGLPGGMEWVILAIIALLVFGGSRLANAGKNAGKAIREFKEETSTLKKPDEPEATPPPAVLPPVSTAEPGGIVHEGEIVPEPKDKGQQA